LIFEPKSITKNYFTLTSALPKLKSISYRKPFCKFEKVPNKTPKKEHQKQAGTQLITKISKNADLNLYLFPIYFLTSSAQKTMNPDKYDA
jgi:hypothetical protein